MTELDIVTFHVRNTSRLFHGRYPFRININNPFKDFYTSEEWDGEENLTLYTNRVATRCAFYEAQVEATVLDFKPWFDQAGNHERCHLGVTPTSFNFYFEEEQDFEYFIMSFRDMIAEVTRPHESFNSELLKTDADVKRSYRPLYFGNFSWKVIFDQETDLETIDYWVEEVMSSDPTRYHYDVTNKQRTLYLACEIDVAMTKISHGAYIQDIEQII